MKKLLCASLLVPVALLACESKTEKPAEPAAETEKAEGEAKPAEKAEKEEKAEAAGDELKLEEMGLVIAMPADSNVTDMMGSKMIQGGGTVVSVKEIKADDTMAPKTFEEAKKAMADYSPTEVTKEEELDDGWHIAFKNEGGMGANYFVWTRRNIGDKSYACETTASSPEQAEKAAEACMSLAPAS